MLRNNIKLSLRSLMKQKGFTFLNIIGLGTGMAISLLIAAFVLRELQTDKFHSQYKNIYRLECEKYAHTASLVADFFSAAIPEAKAICRIQPRLTNELVTFDGKQTRLKELIYADSTFLDIFSFRLIQGDPAVALSEPLSIILSQTEAKKIFGDEHAIGKVLRLNNHLDFIVTGVMADITSNSSIKATAIIPFHALPQVRQWEGILKDWNNWNYNTFVLLHPESDPVELNKKVRTSMDKVIGEELQFGEVDLGFFLRPLSDIYFNRSISNDSLDKGNITFIKIFIAIGVFILIIAVINFINLSTALAFRRSMEVGLKKVLGSSSSMLRRQYLTESVIVSLVALVLALGLFEILIPQFNLLTNSELSINLWKNPAFILPVLGFAIFTGLISGIYPAVYLSRFEPIAVLKKEATKGKKGSLLRKVLIVFQFTISVSIILATIIIFSQMRYARTKDMGFNKNNIIYFPSQGEVAKNYDSFKNEVKQIPGVEYVGISSSIPGYVGMGWGRNVDGQEQRMNALAVDPEFMDVYGLKIKQGRSFDPLMATDRNQAYLLNETAVKHFNLENPVGVSFSSGKVIGVVEDFSYLSVHHGIGPLVLAYTPSFFNYINIKLNGNNIPQTIEQIGVVWESFNPDFPYTANFLDAAIGRLYTREERLSKLFLFFSLLAIFIACLGLSGLALFTTQQRIREIGIRKVFGSSPAAIVGLLTGDFLKWIVLANLIAWPLTWYAMNRWLENFAFRIEIQWWMFAASAVIAVIIALITISFQSVKAALANPVRSLKYE